MLVFVLLICGAIADTKTASQPRGCHLDIGSGWIHIRLIDEQGKAFTLTQKGNGSRNVEKAWGTCRDWLRAGKVKDKSKGSKVIR